MMKCMLHLQMLGNLPNWKVPSHTPVLNKHRVEITCIALWCGDTMFNPYLNTITTGSLDEYRPA